VEYPDNTLSYNYDAVGNRTHVIDIQGVTLYEYDEPRPDRPGDRSRRADGGYEYDERGRRSRLVYPDGQAVSYTYDAAGWLATVSDWDGNTTHYAYDERGQLSVVDYPNGTSIHYTYDELDG